MMWVVVPDETPAEQLARQNSQIIRRNRWITGLLVAACLPFGISIAWELMTLPGYANIAPWLRLLAGVLLSITYTLILSFFVIGGWIRFFNPPTPRAPLNPRHPDPRYRP